MAISTKDQIHQFRASIAPDLFLPHDLVRWEQVEATLDTLRPGIAALQRLVDANRLDSRAIATVFLDEPHAYAAVQHLLFVRGAVGFFDGRELGDRAPTSIEDALSAAELLLSIGLADVLRRPFDVASGLVVALVSEDSALRPKQVTNRFEDRVATLVNTVVASLAPAFPVSLAPKHHLPPAARRKASHIVSVDGRARVAIVSVFEAFSGGRQQRDLMALASLQTELSQQGLSVVVVADGRGIKAAPDSVLERLFKGVALCMSLRQAEEGALEAGLRQMAGSREAFLPNRAPLARIIESTLRARPSIRAAELPAATSDARLALAQYFSDHPDLALILGPDGDSLAWTRGELVPAALNETQTFQPSRIISTFVRILKPEAGPPSCFGSGAPGSPLRAVVNLEPDQVIPAQLLVAGVSGRPAAELTREVARLSLSEAPGARFAVLITSHTLTPTDLSELRKRQALLPVNVVALDVAQVSRLAQSATPGRDALVAEVLEQSDLSKVSPFVLSSVTPSRMFYGREAEEATLVSTLVSNSVALLGGRRIGKTSLMRHVNGRLEEAGYQPFFADCQTVRNWADFGAMARRFWDVDAEPNFHPHDLLDLVAMLARRGSGQVVVLLDEIDQLLDWDSQPSRETVPEGFFRTCRTISQEGIAQFVFSGERTIASKLWDPQSPHWNFCRPLQLQQLTRASSEQLVLEPIRSLRVEFQDESEVRSAIWDRTNGHPQLLQYLGDKLIRRLNERAERSDVALSAEDIFVVADSEQYVEQYLETYWGQATDLERLLSLLIAREEVAGVDARDLQAYLPSTARDAIASALRMLELYGIIERSSAGYALRAEWFPSALSMYGGADPMIETLSSRLR